MRVSDEVLNRNSEDQLARAIHAHSDAGAGVIHLRTNEVHRCLDALRLAITVDDAQYREWDIVNGWRAFDIQSRQNPDVAGDSKLNLAQEIKTPDDIRKSLRQDTSEESRPMQFFVFVNTQYWADNNPIFTHMILHYARELPSTDVRVILVTPDSPLPEAIADSVVTVRFSPPGHGELRKYLDGILSDLSDEIALTEEEKDHICYAGAGMTQEAFEMYASIAIVEANNGRGGDESINVTSNDIMGGVNEGKTAVVNRNDLLELYQIEDMSDVGGLDLLKEWIDKRRNCYTEEATEFGISAPKGIVFVGPPGTGKSLTAKAVAGVLGVPLIRLDFGRVFNSLVGSSEERIRQALRQVTYMAPCVLFIDEIDKGLGGIGGGGGDSGTSSRVLGTFLTWLNDNKAPVFTMVTANNIHGLPPELMRRGRFDDIFASSFPDEVDRREILSIHLRKRGWDIGDFDEEDITAVVEHSNGYSGAEIESAVEEGLIDGFGADETRDTFHLGYIIDAIKSMIPLSQSYNDQIQAMTAWAKGHARPASQDRGDKKVTDIATAKRRVRTRARKDKKGGTKLVH